MLTHATSLASNPGYPICRSMDTGMATERTARREFIRISASLLATNEALKTICPRVHVGALALPPGNIPER